MGVRSERGGEDGVKRHSFHQHRSFILHCTSLLSFPTVQRPFDNLVAWFWCIKIECWSKVLGRLLVWVDRLSSRMFMLALCERAGPVSSSFCCCLLLFCSQAAFTPWWLGTLLEGGVGIRWYPQTWLSGCPEMKTRPLSRTTNYIMIRWLLSA